MYWCNIIPVFLVHAFNVESILCIVNYMIKSNVHNRMPKTGILFTDICLGDFFKRHDLMKHWVEFTFYYYYLWAKSESKRRSEWLQAKRSAGIEGILAERRAAHFTIYSWTIRIMYYVKVGKYIIAIFSLFPFLFFLSDSLYW